MVPPWLERFFAYVFGASWRTALAGLAALLTVLWTPLWAQLDNNPETVPDWNPVLVAVFAFLGFAKARDNMVTSAQAKKDPGITDAPSQLRSQPKARSHKKK